MRPAEARTAGYSSTWKRCPQRRQRGNLEPSSPGKETTPRLLLTILGGASTRMTNRTSQEFSPQFCGRTRRLMHTCRLCRDLEVELAGARRAQFPPLVVGHCPEYPTLTPSDFCYRLKMTKCNRSAPALPLNWVGQPLQGHGIPGPKMTCRKARCGGLATHMMQSHDCWYCTPVAVALTPRMVSDSRWTEDKVEGDRRVSWPTSLTSQPRRGGGSDLCPPWGPQHQ